VTRGEHAPAEGPSAEFPNHPGPKCGCMDCMGLTDMELEWRMEREKEHQWRY
jgi:hypothetical protein